MNWTSLSAKGGGKSLTCGSSKVRGGSFRSSFRERKGGFLFQKSYDEVFLWYFLISGYGKTHFLS